MIHTRLTNGSPLEDSGADSGLNRYRESFAAVEASASAVRRTRRAADESLKRLNSLPEPRTDANPVFVSLLEKHRQDREALFSAMRQLDDAREALRQIAAELARADNMAEPIDRQRAG